MTDLSPEYPPKRTCTAALNLWVRALVLDHLRFMLRLACAAAGDLPGGRTTQAANTASTATPFQRRCATRSCGEKVRIPINRADRSGN